MTNTLLLATIIVVLLTLLGFDLYGIWLNKKMLQLAQDTRRVLWLRDELTTLKKHFDPSRDRIFWLLLCRLENTLDSTGYSEDILDFVAKIKNLELAIFRDATVSVRIGADPDLDPEDTVHDHQQPS